MFKITSREIKRWKIQFFKYKRGTQNSVCFSKWCAFVYNCRFMLLNTCVHLNAIPQRGLEGPIWKHLVWKARKLCRLCCWLLFNIVLSHQIRDSGKFSSKTPFCWNLSIYWGKKKKKGCVVLKWGVWGKRKFLILWFRLSGCCTRISVAYKAECQTRLISVCLNHTCADKIWSLGCKGLFL